MVKNAVLETYAGGQRAAVIQVFVNGVAACEHRAGDEHFLAHFERADDGFGDWSCESSHKLAPGLNQFFTPGFNQ